MSQSTATCIGCDSCGAKVYGDDLAGASWFANHAGWLLRDRDLCSDCRSASGQLTADGRGTCPRCYQLVMTIPAHTEPGTTAPLIIGDHKDPYGLCKGVCEIPTEGLHRVNHPQVNLVETF
jgi:hypothetical protein